MLGSHVLYTHHIPGTLAANHSHIFKLPFDASLVAVSAAGSNANNGIIDVGKTAALEAYLKDMDVGDSSVAAIKQLPSDFVGGAFPHIPAGTNIIVTLDFDGAGGTAINDFTLVLVFTEG